MLRLLDAQNLPPKGWWVFILKPVVQFSLSFILIFGGLFLLLSQVMLPLIIGSREVVISTPLQQFVLGTFTNGSASPLQDVIVKSKETASSEQGLGILTGTTSEIPSEFYLTVPKLEIKNAKVETNASSLSPDFSLGHFRGSGLPGELGTAFIYGHSVLPLFYNPSNYKTIFATLPSLTIGDDFLVEFNNLTFKYQIVSTKVLEPFEVDPLKDYGTDLGSASTVVLMTCYPPGLSSKRFLIIGKLLF